MQKLLKSYRHTKAACYLGYVTQAAVNNFAPLLFLIFQDLLGVSLPQLTALIAVNFGVQLGADVFASFFADKIGYRACMVAAHLFAAAGFAGFALLPRIMPPFAGLLIAAILCACGGGLIEVVVSPTVEACPTKNKSAEMSLLHSFYCWGSVAVIALSSLFLLIFGRENWPILAAIWAALPLVNALYFCFVPIAPLNGGGESMPKKSLLKSGSLWLFVALILTAGAAEISMSQWAPAFAERGLGVSKTVGDLAGPCLFAALMGAARVLYSTLGKRLPLKACLFGSSVLCIACYLVAGLASLPALALAGCALCGFSVGILWPGVFSLAAERMPAGGTAMFAILAVAGDLGGLCGPTTVGALSDALGGNLQSGLLVGLIFPVVFTFCILLLSLRERPRR